MKSKLGLDFTKVAAAKQIAQNIAANVQEFVKDYSTVAVERTLCRLLGIDGVDTNEIPYPNIVVDHLKEKGVLAQGVLFYLGQAMAGTGLSPQQIAEHIAREQLNISTIEIQSQENYTAALQTYIDAAIVRIKSNRKKREDFISNIGEGSKPYIYVIVATGNIYEDVIQAQAAAKQGADIIAVIRSTGQSLLDYVPYGATTEGFGGTFATQENFRIMRRALDEVEKKKAVTSDCATTALVYVCPRLQQWVHWRD